MAAFLKSFVWAGKGLIEVARTERNFRFDLCAAAYVYLFSIFYPFSGRDYLALTLIVAGVLALEIINSAIERIVDLISPGYSAVAGTVKNVAAGAVLIFCIGAAVCGFLMFWNIAVFKSIFSFFSARPLLLVLLAASLVLSGWFVFGYGRAKKER